MSARRASASAAVRVAQRAMGKAPDKARHKAREKARVRVAVQRPRPERRMLRLIPARRRQAGRRRGCQVAAMRPQQRSMVPNAPARARGQHARTGHHFKTEQGARMRGLAAATGVTDGKHVTGGKPPQAVVAGVVALKARRAACRDARWPIRARAAPAAPVIHRRAIPATVRGQARRRRMVQTMRLLRLDSPLAPPIRLGTAHGQASGLQVATPARVQALMRAPMRAAAIRVDRRAVAGAHLPVPIPVRSRGLIPSPILRAHIRRVPTAPMRGMEKGAMESRALQRPGRRHAASQGLPAKRRGRFSVAHQIAQHQSGQHPIVARRMIFMQRSILAPTIAAC
jgi:hypothetical protein